MSDILITPNRGSTNAPTIQFSGSVNASASIRLEVLPEGQVAFLGKSGSLFSISDSMVGSLMAVSDISGLPILEVFSDDKVVMGKYNSNALVVTGSNVGIGKTIPNATLDISGSVIITGSLTSSLDASIHGMLVGYGDSATNTFFGIGIRATGTSNVAVGRNAAGMNNSNAFANVMVGYNAGGVNAISLHSASYNVAVGHGSLFSLYYGTYNTSVGPGAGSSVSSGSYNTLIGPNAGSGLVNGSYNTVIGNVTGLAAGLSSTIILADGGGNIRQYIDSGGNMALGKTTPINAKLDVNGSVAITGSLNVTGSDIYVNKGSSALRVGFGNNALLSNTALGHNTLTQTIGIGTGNTAVGYNVLSSTTIGENNTAVGVQSLNTNSVGGYNVAIGNLSLFNNTSGSSNVSIGTINLYSNTTGINNVSIGRETMYNNSTGATNTAVGNFSLNRNTSGSQNVAFGAYALYSNSVANNNVAIGYNALSNNTSGSSNVAIGPSAGSSITSGVNNIVIGNSTTGITTGANNIVIGNSVTGLSTSLANTIIIADGAGNIRQYIDSSGNMSLGKTSPINAKLDVNGNTIITGSLLVQATTSPAYGNVSLYGDSIYTGFGGGQLAIRGNTNRNIMLSVGINTTTKTGFIQAGEGSGTSQILALNPDGGGPVSINKATSNFPIGGSGLDIYANTIITGSLIVTAGITGSLLGTASYALSSAAAAPDFSPIFMMMGA